MQSEGKFKKMSNCRLKPIIIFSNENSLKCLSFRSVGFGFKKTNNDNWICHQDDFNSLLKNLNASHGRPDQENDEKVISLEEKSKAAKKRVQ